MGRPVAEREQKMSTAGMRKSCAENLKSCDTEPDSALDSPSCGPLTSEESEKIEKLLLADWGDKWGQPLTVDELLEIGKEALDPMFHEAPIGPIPEYLSPHLQVHGCVAEYEDKLEEIDRWKARELDSWLKNRSGRKYIAGRNVYVLRLEEGNSSTPDRYWFEMIEDRNLEKT